MRLLIERSVVRNSRRWSAAFALCFLVALAAPPIHAADTVLQFDPAQTKVEFALDATLHTVHGSFQLRRGSIHFDPATGRAGGEVVIDATSGNSGNSGRDSKMHKSVLESDRYPEIVFTPDRVEGKVPAAGPFEVRVHGLFKIHGAEHEMTLPIRVELAGGQLNATTKFSVPFVTWGMKNPSTFFLRVSENVDIEIRAVARIAPAATAPSR